MKHNSRVTNKVLQQQVEKLETLLKDNKHLTLPKSEVIKTSRVKNFYRQSSAFYLWVITGILGYAHKLPIVRHVIAFLSLWYGRTTWWKLLIKLRRAFITFNAIIGMYMVYKTTGFGTDNLLAGFAGMGHTYFEIFWNFNKRVFNWIFDLFDHKVVPNVPNNPPSNGLNIKPNWFPNTSVEGPTGWKKWYPGIETTPKVDSLRKTYLDDLLNKSINININSTPWYKDFTTWLWIGGGLITVGTIYLGYKFIMDPLFINDLPIIGNWFKSPLDQPVVEVTTPTQEKVVEIVDPSSSKGKGVLKGLGTFMFGGIKKLNPATWFLSSVDHDANRHAFEVAQSNQGYNNNYYPFKAIHPYDSWLKRLRITLFGETTLERETRRGIRNTIWKDLMPPLKLESSPVASSVSSSVTATPRLASVGLGLNLSNIGETGFLNVASKFSSVATTPTHTPVPLPEIVNIDPYNNPLRDALERLTGSKVTSPVVESISTITPVAESSSSVKTFAEIVKPTAAIPVETIIPVVESSKSVIENVTSKTGATVVEVIKTPKIVVETVKSSVSVPVESGPLTPVAEPIDIVKVASKVPIPKDVYRSDKGVFNSLFDEDDFYKNLGI